MDILTSAADAILSDNTEIISTPTKDSTRPILRDLTNSKHFEKAPNHLSNFSLNSLLSERITTKNHALPILKTPRKRRKNSCKYGDENQAPTPKTPKNEQKFEFFDSPEPKLEIADSPATPLSNLKMLTRIASMEEHIPSKKDLFPSQSTTCKSKIKLRRCVSDLPSNQERVKQLSKPKLKKYTTISNIERSQLQEESYKKVTGNGSETSRREKSLGLLCEKFLYHFPMEVSCLETPRRLIIDDVASVLGTERRRVYDIVNILECLNMASRVQKNMYQWMGRLHLESTLSKLKGLAEEWGICAHTTEPVENSIRYLKSGKILSPISLGERIADSRKEKSIGILCQKFLMLFLTSDPPHVIQLETANHLLLGQEGDDIDKLRKRGRRIYDIANVLVALKLITKLPQCKSFKYIGPFVEAVKSEVINGGTKVKLRHSLLPPPISELVRENRSLHLNLDSEVTPEDISNDSVCNGRPGRKLASEFPHSKAKRNCLIAHPKSIESIVPQTVSSVKNCLSSEGVCKDGVEGNYSAQTIKKENKEINKKPLVNNITYFNQGPNMTKIFKFTHGSPRMALTFNDNSNILKSPPTITNKRPLPENCVSKVIVRPPYIFRRVSMPSIALQPSEPLSLAPQNNENSSEKQTFTIRSSNVVNGNQAPNSISVKAVGTKSFKVYTSGRTSAFSPVSDNNIKPVISPSPISMQYNSVSNQPKYFMKSVLPSINLNTMSKNHYKIGTSTQITSPTLSATNSKGSFRFIINSKDNHLTKTQSDPGNGLKEPSFVKMLDNSPDQSGTDSELESIFGDSFNFTRPKSLVKKS